MADCLLGANDLCPRNSHWWRQNRSNQKVANPKKYHRGSKFPGIHGILQAIYPKICSGTPTPHKLTSDENAGKKKAVIQWDNRCQQAFDDLKRLCTTAPILVYADFIQPFKLHIDACGCGLGAVLYQTHMDGTDGKIPLACTQAGISCHQVSSSWKIPQILLWVNLWHAH